MGRNFGSLFSGVGGIDLGLERAGWSCAWQVENDPYCNKVLAKHWPSVRRYGDIKELDTRDLESVDLVCGGFPCQDIARVGRRAGLGGAKSGLWSEFYRVVRDLEPRWVLVENSTSLTKQGLGEILADLSEIGYDAEWDCLPAQAFGAPHIRDRIYLLAYPRGGRRSSPDETVFAGWTGSQLHGGWTLEPGVGRVADGVPARMDRVRCLGNAVVPRVAEWLGQRIMEMAA